MQVEASIGILGFIMDPNTNMINVGKIETSVIDEILTDMGYSKVEIEDTSNHWGGDRRSKYVFRDKELHLNIKGSVWDSTHLEITKSKTE